MAYNEAKYKFLRTYAQGRWVQIKTVGYNIQDISIWYQLSTNLFMDIIIDQSREKLLNAIKYFAEETKYCGKTKLLKLLYFLDFEHYKQTGRSVTNLDYEAWEMGPVPVRLYEEMTESPKEDFKENISLSEIETSNGEMVKVEAKDSFNEGIFTKRELNILKGLSKRYRYSDSDHMIDETHLENEPWDKVFKIEGREYEKIPYDYAVEDTEDEVVKDIQKEREEFIANLS